MISQTEETKYCPRCGIVPRNECVLTAEGIMHNCPVSDEDKAKGVIMRQHSCYADKKQYEKFQRINEERRRRYEERRRQT